MAGIEYLISLETIPDQLLPARAKKSISVNENKTVSDVKLLIARQTGIPSNEQILVYHEAPLVDECEKLQEVVNKHQVRPDGANITLLLLIKSVEPVFARVTMNIVDEGKKERTIAVMVESSATVGQLKTKIDKIEGIPPSRQSLVAGLNGCKSIAIPLSDDNARLMDVVFEDSTIRVFTVQVPDGAGNKLPIKVVMTSSSDLLATFKMEFGVDTVNTLIAKINKSEIVESQLPGIKAFSLHLRGQRDDDREVIELIRGDYTLSSYGINTANRIVYLTPSNLG